MVRQNVSLKNERLGATLLGNPGTGEQRIAYLKAPGQAAAAEAERLRVEQERIEAELERRRKEEELEALERERQKEMEMQKKLKTMGLCPMGFSWIKQAAGFRCAGGSHFIANGNLP